MLKEMNKQVPVFIIYNFVELKECRLRFWKAKMHFDIWEKMHA